VELANTLRAILSAEDLILVKRHFGGLLALLEKYPDTFAVVRIPKSDMVKLVSPVDSQMSPVVSSTAANPPVEAGAMDYEHGMSWRMGGPTCPVLSTLTSEQMVPSAAWPSATALDLPWVRLVADRMHRLGGSATVSRLRGVLRQALGPLAGGESIKSVPLKALLRAYAQHFELTGNFVRLTAVPPPPGPLPGELMAPPPAAPMMMVAPPPMMPPPAFHHGYHYGPAGFCY